MKKFLTILCWGVFCATLALIAVQLIWSPVKSFSVEATTSSKTSDSGQACALNEEHCDNVAMSFERVVVPARTETSAYGGSRINWFRVKGLGSIRRKGKFLVAHLPEKLLGGIKATNISGTLIYGRFGKKGQYRIFRNYLWASGKAPLKRRLKTTKDGKKHLLVLTSASLGLQSPLFPLPPHPVANGY